MEQDFEWEDGDDEIDWDEGDFNVFECMVAVQQGIFSDFGLVATEMLFCLLLSQLIYDGKDVEGMVKRSREVVKEEIENLWGIKPKKD